jgi:hypothetical protein
MILKMTLFPTPLRYPYVTKVIYRKVLKQNLLVLLLWNARDPSSTAVNYYSNNRARQDKVFSNEK